MTLPSISSIGIIGGGVSGVLLAIQLMQQSQSPLRIYLVEENPPIGLGIAYRTSFDEHLLNVPASGMSLFPEQPQHFSQWLEAHFPEAYSAEDFVPRRWFGWYVQDVFEKSRRSSASRVHFQTYCSGATRIERSQGQARIGLADGRQLGVDAVVLALGNYPPADPVLAQVDWPDHFYFSNPWNEQLYQHAQSLEQVLLIGAGLTALDVVIGLEKKGYRGQYHLVSTHALLPRVHQPFGNHMLTFDISQLPDRLSARELILLFRRELVQAQGDWRAVIQALRPLSVALWRRLPPEQQVVFLRRLAPFWNVHRHRIAPAIAEQVDQLRVSGRLRIWQGRVRTVGYEKQEGTVELKLKQAPHRVSLPVNRIINCTGPQGDYNWIARQNPLVGNLMAQGLLRPDFTRTGLDAKPDGRLLGADGQPSSYLFTLGTPMKGILFECTSVPEIRKQADELATLLLGQLKCETPLGFFI